MALGSQATNVELMAALTGLTHSIFVGRVVNNVRRSSPTSMLFQDASPGEYRLEGQNMTFAVDLRFKTGMVASDGKLPDYVGLDAVQGFITPVRRYERLAIDNLVEKQASGPGAFENLSDRIFDKLWDAWESGEIRHSIGPSSGLVGVVEGRTSGTEFTIKDAYGNADTNPLTMLAEGSIICWYDQTATAGIDGAAKIVSINYSTRLITIDAEATWEPGDDIAAGDYIFFATSNNISNANFVAERNLAPNGLGTLVDPAAALTTVHNISETTYQRWKPFRQASTTFDHLELTEHWLQLGQKRGFPVSPATDEVIAYPSAVAQVARSLLGFQQQNYTGDQLKGGYRSVNVSGMNITEDGHFYHNVAMTLCKEKMYRINLGGDADFWGEDGSMWSRIADYDGKDSFVVDYMNCLCTHRGANGALTGITTDVTDADFAPIPNY
jgi:hypothetical protein